MKYAVILFYLISPLFSYCQDDHKKFQDTVFIKTNKSWDTDSFNYVVDTVIFETGMRRHILTGTTILPWTHNQMSAKAYGLNFEKVTKSNCLMEEPGNEGELNNKINSVLVTDSSLTIDFNLYDNCCYDFLCDISVNEKGVLNLIYTGYGTYCACECCFGLTYHLKISKLKETPKIKSIIINNELV